MFELDGTPDHFWGDWSGFSLQISVTWWLSGRISPRSSDLTICDFFLWGYLREKVYSHSIRKLDHMEEAIRNKIAEIPVDFFESSLQNYRHHCEDCSQSNGGCVEQFLLYNIVFTFCANFVE